MMRTTCLAVVCLAALWATGCGPQADMDADAPTNVMEEKGLRVRIALPSRRLTIGEEVPVRVTATNTTDEAIEIHSPSGAPALVTVTRQTMMLAEQVREYPEAATAQVLSWTLPAGQSRQFVLRVPVEPDWPVDEILYISAELNGYSQIAPAVAVLVHDEDDGKPEQAD